jgi:hypothetical protein
METVRKKSSVRAMFALGIVAVSAVAIACAPPPSAPSGPTTTTTTTTTSTTLPWSTPTGVWTNFNLTCYVNVLGTNYTFPQSASVNADAPATAAAGSTFYMTLAPGVFTAPTNVQGFDLTGIQNFTIRFPISPNMQVLDTVLSAGISIGGGIPNVSVANGLITYTVPGPFPAGQPVQMPKVRLLVKAIGTPGTTIQTKMTNLSNVATFTVGSVDVICYPDNANLTFWTTAII